jgi:MarR family transcriptional repressor of emrRAB
METKIANWLGALSLAVMDRIEQGAREVVGRGGETPAALVVIGYGQGMTNDKLRRILGLSHPGFQPLPHFWMCCRRLKRSNLER